MLELSEARNAEYMEQNQWEPSVLALLAKMNQAVLDANEKTKAAYDGFAVNISDLLQAGLGVPLAAQKLNKTGTMVTSVLKAQRYTQQRLRYDGAQLRYWVSPDASNIYFWTAKQIGNLLDHR
jgi:hypothetical protein